MGKGTIDNPAMADAVRHIYVHIPVCARMSSYCAFYKERADPAQATRFCDAIVRELSLAGASKDLRTETIFLAGNADRSHDGTIGYPARRIPCPTRFVRTAGVDPGSESRKRFGTKGGSLCARTG